MAKFTIQDKNNAVLQYLQGEQPKGRSPMKKKKKVTPSTEGTFEVLQSEIEYFCMENA